MKSTEMSRDFTPDEFEDLRTGSTASRGRTPEPETKHPEHPRSPGRNPSTDRDNETPRDARPDNTRSQDPRAVFYERDRAYRLGESELHTLTELGKFRVISTEDLARHAYQDHREEMDHDIRNLAQQGLIRQGAFEGPEASRREMLTLTKEGHRLIRANRFVPEGQSTYHGFVKPKEANHDADIYQLYQKEASRILDEGGKNLRVVLDF
jgi:DNA-binding MarR family transcriptional regulator